MAKYTTGSTITFLDDRRIVWRVKFPLEQVPKFDFIVCIRPTLNL